jgi:hypothetical protein
MNICFTGTTDKELFEIINIFEKNPNDENYKKADAAMRELFIRKGATEKQTQRTMYYAYEHGHSAGNYEIILIAKELLYIFSE